MGIIYFLSIVFLFTSILSIKKVDRKINAVGTFLVTIIAYMCYQAILAYFFDLLRIPITPLNVSICNIILSCTISTIHYLKVKDFQKYYIKKQDIIFIIILLAVNLPILYTEFGLLDNFRYISTDAIAHSQAAMTFTKNNFILESMKNWGLDRTFMIGSYMNDGLLMKALVNVLGEFNLYKIYIFDDISYYLMIGYIFYLLLTCSKKCNTNFKYIMAYIISIIFMIGYPLNSTITGFHYFTFGILQCITILYVIKTLYKENSKILYFILFLLNTGIMLTYNLIAPIIYLTEFVYFIYGKINNKDKIFTIENFLKLTIIFLIPGTIGMCFYILPKILSNNSTAETQSLLSSEGYIYINFYSNIILFIPFVIYFVVKKVKANKLNLEFIALFTIIILITLMFIGLKLGYVSTYYFMKQYYLLNAIIFIIIYRCICYLIEDSKEGKILAVFLTGVYITLLCFNLLFLNIDPYGFQKENESITKVFDIYNSNKAIMKLLINNFPKDRIDSLEYISDNNLINEQNLLFLGNYLDNFLFKMFFTYENREGIDKNNTLEHIIKWNQGEYEYLVIFPKENTLKYYKDYLELQNSKIIFETENSVIYKSIENK